MLVIQVWRISPETCWYCAICGPLIAVVWADRVTQGGFRGKATWTRIGKLEVAWV